VGIKWDRTIGNFDGTDVLRIKNFFKLNGIQIRLHQMLRADGVQKFHTHPSKAIRIVLWGGYVEELESGDKVTCRPGFIGWVRPAHSHRVDSLLNGKVSYSLWLRWPDTHKVKLRGSGWPAGVVGEA
jgi:hypothetical protein